AGATAALDLARRGYPVVLHEAAGALGGSARRRPAGVLPPQVLADDLDAVRRAGAQVFLDHPVDSAEFEHLCATFDAVVVCSGPAGQAFGLPGDDGGVLHVDPVTFATGRAGVFAAGAVTGGPGEGSPIRSVSEGRRA